MCRLSTSPVLAGCDEGPIPLGPWCHQRVPGSAAGIWALAQAAPAAFCQRALYSGRRACQSRRRAGSSSVCPWTGHGGGTRPRMVALMVVLDGASLTLESLAAVAEGQDEVVLAPAARDRMA